MSFIHARKKRTTLQLLLGVLIAVTAVSALSALDPSGAAVRVGMIMVTLGAGMWLPWRLLIPAVVLTWLLPNLARGLIEGQASFALYTALELPGLVVIGCLTAVARKALGDLEGETLLLGAGSGDVAGVNPETGVFFASQLRPALQAELARSTRFGRTFALVVADIDEMRQKFDYRNEADWKAGLDATTRLLRQTRHNVDRVYHYKDHAFAMILPEADEKDIAGLVRRLRRLARSMKPPEGEPGGPLPVHFGATFFPDCATTVDYLLMRAEVALRIAAGNTTRYQIDSAEAPAPPPPETLRRDRLAVSGEPVQVAAMANMAPSPAVDPAGAQPVTFTPVGAGASQDGGAAAEQGDALEPEELEGLLQRINNTLRMIRSVRDRAA